MNVVARFFLVLAVVWTAGPLRPSECEAQDVVEEPQLMPEADGERSRGLQSQPPHRTDSRPFSLTVGVKEWISQGRSAHNLADVGGTPNVVSELQWRGLNVPVTQVTADLVYHYFVANMVVGYGSRGHGNLQDQDWSGNNRTDEISDTLSTVTGASVLIFSISPGARFLSWTVRDNPIQGGLDLLLGYQLWRERYEASGVQDLFTGMTTVPSSVLAITQTNTWQSFRLGTRATVPVYSRLVLKGSAFYIPVSAYRNEDVHHLRTDLQQNPSFLTTATGGNGVQLEGSLLVRVWRELTVEAGYAYWDIRSGPGTVQAFFADGTTVTSRHNEENTRRQGVFFGVNWTF